MYDAVVIGAGHNGLVAANLLASSGWSVLVLEAADEPGGAVRSAEVMRPGFVTDLFSAFYPMGAASPVLRWLQLERYGLRWRHAPAVLAHPLEDGRCALLSRDIDRTAESLAEFAPGDGRTWRRLYGEWQRIGPTLIEALFRPFPPLGSGVKLLRALGAADALRFARFAVMSVRRYGEEEFDGEGGRLLLTGNAMHTDLPPEGAGSAVFGWLLTMVGQQFGYPVPEGGSGRLTDALVRRLRGYGGELACGRRVVKVLVRGGRAVGVRTADGTEIGARYAVLAAVAAPILYRDLVEPAYLPARLLGDLDRFQWDSPTLKLNWALSGPIPWKAEDARLAGTVHLGGDRAALTDYAADLACGRLPRTPFVIFGQMTTADPTRSPAGTESAWAYTHLPRRPLSAEELAAQVTAVEELVERYAPGFRDLVLDRLVQTPSELEAADANLVAGAVNGGTASLHQQLVFRPVPGLGRPETPLPGLYLAGASAHPGGGVHGACGANAAHAALRARRSRYVSLGIHRAQRYLNRT
ncbi:FAD-dependent oxidoreductase [Carbonactinospora thermoautotrophica]|uniref:phytoene desaturase family protein n=1 Tax=Carbonactinospora thermoautotrophica TaxID=1469144 RepID=UPI002270E823|nr:NAD(P)/FAD-dependent oxidoreductase [Carbonactinospora thermoautotrophica]MCX9192714.1 FAD-dependent oxidoreductase [Carbonactinospora thermoautotrophica]